MNREKIVQVKVSPEEYKILLSAMQISGLTLASFIRYASLQKARTSMEVSSQDA